MKPRVTAGVVLIRVQNRLAELRKESLELLNNMRRVEAEIRALESILNSDASEDEMKKASEQ